MRKILFITGTRADYGKLKSLMKAVEGSEEFEAYIYVSGMHLIEILGNTYREVLKDNYKNTYVAYGLASTRDASYDLGDVICNLTGYVDKVKPDMIVVHGDRIDALAGACVGALKNILVAHIEGGELSGTVDESIRHAISKIAQIHMVSNEEAKKRLLQLGEEEKNIYIIGSPDIDIMLSPSLPDMDTVRDRYEISFDKYAIMMYHPVTTEFDTLGTNISEIVDALINSERNYVVIYPNNDLGYETILNEYRRFEGNSHFRVFPSLRFEYFLTLLKNSDFIIGNSSAGIRESGIYGIPAIDIGSRQSGRYTVTAGSNIEHVSESSHEISEAILKTESKRKKCSEFGDGSSTEKFMSILSDEKTWETKRQKHFVDRKVIND